jgi:hypothetical protein
MEVKMRNLAATGTGVGPKGRIYFADYLRAALVSLMILHHISITYGASGSFYARAQKWFLFVFEL